MKKILLILGVCLLAGYLIFIGFFFDKKPKDQICNKFDIEIDADSVDKFIETADIEKYIDKEGLNPYGKQLKDINTYAIQEALLANKMIQSAEVFVTSSGGIRATIKQRTPILRVMTSAGENYYIDKKGERMPTSNFATIYLPIATGEIKEDFAKTDLYNFTLFLQGDEFWNAQIEQIVVQSDSNIILIPRIGDQKIVMGGLDNYQDKLDRLKTFYSKVLPKTGWNRYSIINLKYDKQVIGTKR